jgi:ABC-2 type transport system permease protein
MTFKELWHMYYALYRKEMVRILRIWPQSLIPSAITISLYFMIFGKVIGERVGALGGLPYIEFITPGLIIMAVLTNTYSNTVSSFYGGRFSRAIEELLVSPVPNYIIILGYISGSITRGFAIGLLVSIVAALFDAFQIHNIILFLFSFIFCGALFALGGLLNGIFSQSFDDTTIFSNFVLTPLIYLGGVFYSLDMLPEPWHTIAAFNPIFYIVDLFRYACLGVSIVSPWWSFSAVILFCMLFFGFNLYCLNKGIRLKA